MWYIVYARNLNDPTLEPTLEDKGIDYYIPVHVIEKPNAENNKIEAKKVYPLGKLIFVRTDDKIQHLIKQCDCLQGIYRDLATNECATVPDKAMNAFRLFTNNTNNRRLKFLHDPYSHFSAKQKVRVRAGEFEGQEGRIVRIDKSRKLVIELGGFAVAISGIDPSMLEPLDD